MATEHNFYFRPFCPKNTISCGAVWHYSPYIGILENAFLTDQIYDPEPQNATCRSNEPMGPEANFGGERPSSGNVTKIQ